MYLKYIWSIVDNIPSKQSRTLFILMNFAAIQEASV